MIKLVEIGLKKEKATRVSNAHDLAQHPWRQQFLSHFYSKKSVHVAYGIFSCMSHLRSVICYLLWCLKHKKRHIDSAQQGVITICLPLSFPKICMLYIFSRFTIMSTFNSTVCTNSFLLLFSVF